MCSRTHPSPRPRRAHLGIAFLLFPLAAGLACGKKGDPLPPLSLVPRAATDLAVHQRGGDLLLEVTYPSLTTSGVPLPGLAALEVLRLARPLAPGAPAAPPDRRQFGPAAQVAVTVTGAELASATQGGELHLRLPLLAATGEPREAHTYAVRFVGKGGERGDFSNLVTVVPSTPPPAPGGLAVEATPAGIEVSWSAAGESVAGYRVYRRRAQERTYGPPLAAVPAAATSYVDGSARFGERYIYAVTAVAGALPAAPPASGGAQPPPGAEPPGQTPAAEGAESALAAEREVDYRDRFPPEPPAQLVALAEPGQVRLSWQPSAAPDLAGYHVYRRQLPDGPLTRLTAAPLSATTLLAPGLAAGTRHAFQVTAVDASGNESGPGAAAEATAQ